MRYYSIAFFVLLTAVLICALDTRHFPQISTMYEKGKFSLGEQCKHPEGDLQPKYQCFFCGLQLHPVVFGCSEVHDDDKVKCIDGCGIRDDQSEQSQLTNILVYARKPTRHKDQEFNVTRYPTYLTFLLDTNKRQLPGDDKSQVRKVSNMVGSHTLWIA